MGRHALSLGVFGVLGSVVFASLAAPPPPGDGKPPPALSRDSAGPACNRDGSQVKEINSIVNSIEAGAFKPKSVDEFLGLLPDSLRSSMMFTADSHSIQESNLENPRVILKSPNSEVTLSFSTGKGLRGSDAVELQIWDPKEKRFNMLEVRFPHEDDPNYKPPRGKQFAEVDRNPSKCTTCHGGGDGKTSPRPVFDPYRQWSGFVPFSEDRLIKDSPERGWFQGYLKRIEGKEPRLGKLKPLISNAQIDEQFKTQNKVALPSAQSWSTQPTNTPGLDMSHQFLHLNGCRIISDLKKDKKRWDAIKYALAGGLQHDDCKDPTIFLPKELNESAGEWFKARGIGTKDKNFKFKSVLDDTHKRQARLSEVRESSELWFLEKNLGSAEKAEEVVALADKHNIRGRGRSGGNLNGYARDEMMIIGRSRFPAFESTTDEVAKVRYLLEPLGIQTNLWSTAIDPETYAHVEFFGEIERQPEIQEILKETGYDCDVLAAKSRAALLAATPKPDPKFILDASFCAGPGVDEIVASQFTSTITDVARANYRAAAAEVLKRHCSDCHGPEQYIEGAPELPFDDIQALERLIASRKNRVWNFADSIWDRVSRPPDSYNAMPLGGTLSKADKITIRSWLNTL